IAFLYLDGHVREYHGKEPLTKAKKAQRQVATPAATDVWVNDGQGVPLLVVTLPMNEHLTLVLEPIVAEVQTLMGPPRRITVLRDDGRQTVILTNRTDLTAAAVAYHLFQRWRQENYFKYMEAEYALDALIEYAAEELPAEADRPNPRRAQLNKQLRQARAEVARLQAELGEQVEANAE